MTETAGTADVHVALTGAAGYIGSRVLAQLQETHPDWTVTALDNFYRGTVRQVGDADVEYVDIRQREDLTRALTGADIAMHLAAVSGVDDCEDNPDRAHEVNVQATNDVAYHCRQTGAALVFPFSMAVLGDPQEFPVTVDHPRDPMNWYGRTKLLGEHAIEDFAAGAFPAHLLMISNLYGDHAVGGQRVSKGTVINFFVDRALANEAVTVYKPGTQSRNFIHVEDVARAYLRAAERLVDQLGAGETGVEKYEIASDEDPSVESIAELVREVAVEHGYDPSVELVENPRGDGETLVSDFPVDTARAREQLEWAPRRNVGETVRELFERRA